MRFDNAEQANDYMARLKENNPDSGKHSYIIPPNGSTGTPRSRL